MAEYNEEQLRWLRSRWRTYKREYKDDLKNLIKKIKDDEYWDASEEYEKMIGSSRYNPEYEVEIVERDLRGIDLSKQNLSGADLSEADLSGADLSEADLSGADLLGAKLSYANLAEVSYNTDEIIFRRKYPPQKPPESSIRKPTNFEGIDTTRMDSSKNPVLKRHIDDYQFIQAIQENHKRVYWIWRVTSDCGRSLLIWGLCSVIFILIFGAIYRLGLNEYFVLTNEQLGKIIHWYDYMYYSVVTFTTLGFGDIVPSQFGARLVVALEVIIGYIMLGGLVSIFANKMARRA